MDGGDEGASFWNQMPQEDGQNQDQDGDIFFSQPQHGGGEDQFQDVQLTDEPLEDVDLGSPMAPPAATGGSISSFNSNNYFAGDGGEGEDAFGSAADTTVDDDAFFKATVTPSIQEPDTRVVVPTSMQSTRAVFPEQNFAAPVLPSMPMPAASPPVATPAPLIKNPGLFDSSSYFGGAYANKLKKGVQVNTDVDDGDDVFGGGGAGEDTASANAVPISLPLPPKPSPASSAAPAPLAAATTTTVTPKLPLFASFKATPPSFLAAPTLSLPSAFAIKPTPIATTVIASTTKPSATTAAALTTAVAPERVLESAGPAPVSSTAPPAAASTASSVPVPSQQAQPADPGAGRRGEPLHKGMLPRATVSQAFGGQLLVTFPSHPSSVEVHNICEERSPAAAAGLSPLRLFQPVTVTQVDDDGNTLVPTVGSGGCLGPYFQHVFSASNPLQLHNGHRLLFFSFRLAFENKAAQTKTDLMVDYLTSLIFSPPPSSSASASHVPMFDSILDSLLQGDMPMALESLLSSPPTAMAHYKFGQMAIAALFMGLMPSPSPTTLATFIPKLLTKVDVSASPFSSPTTAPSPLFHSMVSFLSTVFSAQSASLTSDFFIKLFSTSCPIMFGPAASSTSSVAAAAYSGNRCATLLVPVLLLLRFRSRLQEEQFAIALVRYAEFLLAQTQTRLASSSEADSMMVASGVDVCVAHFCFIFANRPLPTATSSPSSSSSPSTFSGFVGMLALPTRREENDVKSSRSALWVSHVQLSLLLHLSASSSASGPFASSSSPSLAMSFLAYVGHLLDAALLPQAKGILSILGADALAMMKQGTLSASSRQFLLQLHAVQMRYCGFCLIALPDGDANDDAVKNKTAYANNNSHAQAASPMHNPRLPVHHSDTLPSPSISVQQHLQGSSGGILSAAPTLAVSRSDGIPHAQQHHHQQPQPHGQRQPVQSMHDASQQQQFQQSEQQFQQQQQQQQYQKQYQQQYQQQQFQQPGQQQQHHQQQQYQQQNGQQQRQPAGQQGQGEQELAPMSGAVVGQIIKGELKQMSAEVGGFVKGLFSSILPPQVKSKEANLAQESTFEYDATSQKWVMKDLQGNILPEEVPKAEAPPPPPPTRPAMSTAMSGPPMPGGPPAGTHSRPVAVTSRYAAMPDDY